MASCRSGQSNVFPSCKGIKSSIGATATGSAHLTTSSGRNTLRRMAILLQEDLLLQVRDGRCQQAGTHPEHLHISAPAKHSDFYWGGGQYGDYVGKWGEWMTHRKQSGVDSNPGASSGRRTMLMPFPRCCISSSKSFGELTAFRSGVQPKHDKVEQSKPQTHRTRTQAVILGHRWSRHHQHNRKKLVDSLLHL